MYHHHHHKIISIHQPVSIQFMHHLMHHRHTTNFFHPSAPFMHPSTITPFVSIHQLMLYVHPSIILAKYHITFINSLSVPSINHTVKMHQCIPKRVPWYGWYYQDDKTLRIFHQKVHQERPSPQSTPTNHPSYVNATWIQLYNPLLFKITTYPFPYNRLSTAFCNFNVINLAEVRIEWQGGARLVTYKRLQSLDARLLDTWLKTSLCGRSRSFQVTSVQ